jgi:hypothetical protein
MFCFSVVFGFDLYFWNLGGWKGCVAEGLGGWKGGIILRTTQFFFVLFIFNFQFPDLIGFEERTHTTRTLRCMWSYFSREFLMPNTVMPVHYLHYLQNTLTYHPLQHLHWINVVDFRVWIWIAPLGLRSVSHTDSRVDLLFVTGSTVNILAKIPYFSPPLLFSSSFFSAKQ